MFTACLESIFRKLKWETKGNQIDGEYIRNLRFTDDIVLFAYSTEDFKNMIVCQAIDHVLSRCSIIGVLKEYRNIVIIHFGILLK